jgi:hypothetical protein
MEQDKLGQDRTVQDSTGQDSTGQDRTAELSLVSFHSIGCSVRTKYTTTIGRSCLEKEGNAKSLIDLELELLVSGIRSGSDGK